MDLRVVDAPSTSGDVRVGSVPIITSSRGTTSILMPGAILIRGSSKTAGTNSEDKRTHDGGVKSFGVIYANGPAGDAILANPLTIFPINSIIVREKRATPADEQPQHLTVMIKRERGFNPKANDWEFLSVNATGTKVLQRQKNGSCVKCHATQAATDFVYPVNNFLQR
ncbi:MAG TPA: cytochrome P460 family protein [Pyrinomonadaceae bacterium]|nr:cytochrome P460 family protein [Pyrinomonadaceae bacterium]